MHLSAAALQRPHHLRPLHPRLLLLLLLLWVLL
jgi:hypothetical protein